MLFLPQLESRQPLVDVNSGQPSAYFLRYLKDRGGALTDLEAMYVGRQIIAGLGLNGGGVLSAGDVTIDADVQAILDEITTTQGAVLYRAAAGWVPLLPGTAGQVLTTNGAAAGPTWEDAATVTTRQVGFQIVGTAPTASEVLFSWSPVVGETVVFPDDFVGSSYKKISSGTNPAATYTMVVKKNASTVGSIAISTSGVVTFATTGTTVSVIGGTDTIEVHAPVTPDAGALGYTFTFLGNI